MVPSVPNTRAGRRVITREPSLLAELRAHRVKQNERRLALGEVWRDHGLVFTTEVGTPISGYNLLRQCETLARKAGAPYITIHGIHHTVATLAIAMGQDIRTLADLLGHSRTSITTDTYAHVMPHRTRELTRAISTIVLGEAENADQLRTAEDESDSSPKAIRLEARKQGGKRIIHAYRPKGSGARGRIRTRDTWFRRPVLYPLSYPSPAPA